MPGTKLEEYISAVIKEGGSDLHLSTDYKPTIRVADELIPLVKADVLKEEDTLGFLDVLLTPEYKERFLKDKEIDFSYQYSDGNRFRGNCYISRGRTSIALRLIPEKIKTMEELLLPPILKEFTSIKQGFFLVVGPIGTGKSTTLAAMVDLINTERAAHILTIEDPIEFIYEQKKSIIDQREVGVDTADFQIALKQMFRQDIDVAMIGEMRGKETISTAVTAAETGHLVFSTLHTNNAAQTIDRIIDNFPAEQQRQIRLQLAGSLTGIFSQRLIPRTSGDVIPAYELLINNSAVSNLIREARTHEIGNVIETGMEDGMVDMNRSLAELVRSGEITVENAIQNSLNPAILKKLL
jgi:twitching motility protein PilT